MTVAEVLVAVVIIVAVVGACVGFWAISGKIKDCRRKATGMQQQGQGDGPYMA